MISNTLRFLMQHPLTRQQRGKTLRRFVTWQIASRVFTAPALIPFVDQTRLMFTRGQHAATGNLYVGLHEFDEMAFTLHALRPSDLFVDVGANIGAYTLLASGCAGANSIAIEPVHSTFRTLMDNVNLNGIAAKVHAIECGLGARVGYLHFSQHADSCNHVVLGGAYEARQAVPTPVSTLDEVLQGQHAHMLKIDVEGFEGEVLAGGARELAGRHPCALIIELGQGGPYGHPAEAVDATLRSKGFSPATYSPTDRTLNPIFRTHLDGNVLYLRDLEFFRKRVATAPKFSVLGSLI